MLCSLSFSLKDDKESGEVKYSCPITLEVTGSAMKTEVFVEEVEERLNSSSCLAIIWAGVSSGRRPLASSESFSDSEESSACNCLAA